MQGSSNISEVKLRELENPVFSESSSRVNIDSGESVTTLFGKIKKWFADLKAVAFSGSYNDLSDKPTIPTIPGVVSKTANGLAPQLPNETTTTKYLRQDGSWAVPPDNNTTYSAGTGISLSGTTFSNSGVRSIATGGSNGTISVNTNGTSANVAVKGLGSAAYKDASGSRGINITGSSASCTGNAANVTGTVAIANGGTGATTRLNALKALTNENVSTNATYFLTITDSWAKGGYSSVANAKSVLGIANLGDITIYSGVYTTASWTTGSNTAIWKAPAAGTYIMMMKYQAQSETSGTATYHQFSMKGTTTLHFGAPNFWNGDSGVSNATTPIVALVINDIAIATAANQTVIPYIHTGVANIKWNVKIVGIRIK